MKWASREQRKVFKEFCYEGKRMVVGRMECVLEESFISGGLICITLKVNENGKSWKAESDGMWGDENGRDSEHR